MPYKYMSIIIYIYIYRERERVKKALLQPDHRPGPDHDGRGRRAAVLYYAILYTIYYILYTRHYILYTIYDILYILLYHTIL